MDELLYEDCMHQSCWNKLARSLMMFVTSVTISLKGGGGRRRNVQVHPTGSGKKYTRSGHTVRYMLLTLLVPNH